MYRFEGGDVDREAGSDHPREVPFGGFSRRRGLCMRVCGLVPVDVGVARDPS